MSQLKRFVKSNSHNRFFKALAGFGRSLNRFYENRNHDINSNGEITVLKKLALIKPSVIIDGGDNNSFSIKTIVQDENYLYSNRWHNRQRLSTYNQGLGI